MEAKEFERMGARSGHGQPKVHGDWGQEHNHVTICPRGGQQACGKWGNLFEDPTGLRAGICRRWHTKALGRVRNRHS